MGRAMEVIAGTVTAPGSTITALTAAAPGSFTIRNANVNTDVRLLGMWAEVRSAGVFRIRSPRLHDAVNGIRTQVQNGIVTPLIPQDPLQKLVPQDLLTVELSGSSTAGKIETGCFIVYHQDMPSVSARFIDAPTLRGRGVNIAGVEIDTTPGTGGGWTGGSALNKTEQNLKANTDYALIGYTMSAPAAAIAVSGPDTGNLYVGGPGYTAEFELLQEWFIRLSRMSGAPCIPVINAANQGGTNLYIAQDEGGAAVNVSLNLVELAPAGAAGSPSQIGAATSS